jgi:Protein of unknown function (DUF4235)
MKKLFFAPFSLAGGIVAGFVGKKLFDQVWGLIDDQEPPDGSIHRTGWSKLLIATALEGAIFRATKAAFDRGARTGFLRLTGSWPGDEEPEPE